LRKMFDSTFSKKCWCFFLKCRFNFLWKILDQLF
jgi:hypothetical protein